jgi:hypothetical protein
MRESNYGRRRVGSVIEQALTDCDDLFAGHGTSSQSASALAALNAPAFENADDHDGLLRRGPAVAAGIRSATKFVSHVVKRTASEFNCCAFCEAVNQHPVGVCAFRAVARWDEVAPGSACSARCRSKLDLSRRSRRRATIHGSHLVGVRHLRWSMLRRLSRSPNAEPSMPTSLSRRLRSATLRERPRSKASRKGISSSRRSD